MITKDDMKQIEKTHDFYINSAMITEWNILVIGNVWENICNTLESTRAIKEEYKLFDIPVENMLCVWGKKSTTKKILIRSGWVSAVKAFLFGDLPKATHKSLIGTCYKKEIRTEAGFMLVDR